jgi:hypothetical protein
MSEWWSYGLSDFLLFSPRTYYRLFELYNAAVWPAQIAAIAVGLAILVLLRRPSAVQGRVVAALLAACWLWVAVAFHLERYATINWAASYFAAGFAVEAALLLWIGVARGGLGLRLAPDLASRVGLGIFLVALAVQPLIGPVLGRGWRSAEIFGLAPDPTAVATLGLLLPTGGRPPWLLMILPVLWCAFTGTTLWTMEAPDFWVAPLAAVLVVMLAARRAQLSVSPSAPRSD